MTDVLVPSSTIPVSGDDLPTVPYYQFFEDVSHALTLVADEDSLKELDVRVTALENEDTEQVPIKGQMSIAVAPPNLISGAYTVSLKHDSQYPGNTAYYGTGPTGAKGWNLVADALAESANIGLTVGADGVTTFDLTDVTDTNTGTLQGVTVDAKGRVTGTRDATITGTAGRVTVAHGDASDGLPTIDLADVTVTAGGALKKRSFDAKGRLSAEDDANLDDLADVPAYPATPTTDKHLVLNHTTGLFEWQDAGAATVAHEDSQGIALTGDGTTASKLKATPIISAVTGNKLSVKTDGLFTDSGGIHIDDRVSTYAALPSPPTEGTGATYLVKNGGSYPDNLLYVWNGTGWDADGEGAPIIENDGRIAKFPVPQLTDFDAPIGTSTTWVQRDNRITCRNSSATIANVWLMQNLPSAPFTIDIECGMLITASPSSDAAVMGIGVSDGTKIRSIHVGYWASNGNINQIELGTWSNAQTFAGSTFHYGNDWDFPVRRTFLRITDDGTNRNYWSSANGRDWCGWMGTTGEANTTGLSGVATKAALFVRTAPGIGIGHAFVYGWRVADSVLGQDD